jgi:hypothetical protein
MQPAGTIMEDAGRHCSSAIPEHRARQPIYVKDTTSPCLLSRHPPAHQASAQAFVTAQKNFCVGIEHKFATVH